MRRAALGLALWAGVAAAGWDSPHWPAYLHSRDGRWQNSNTVEAVNERLTVVGATLADGPHWYRTQRGDLMAYKDAITPALSEFVDVRLCPDPAAWLNADTNRTPADLPRMNPTNFPAYGLASNLLTYTPPRALAGDYHWTNAQTAAGGLGTNCTTANYGWDALRGLTTNLTETVSIGAWAYWWGDHATNGNKYGLGGVGSAQPDMSQIDVVLAEAVAAWTYDLSGGLPYPQAYMGLSWQIDLSWYTGPDGVSTSCIYQATAVSTWHTWQSDALATNWTHAVGLYLEGREFGFPAGTYHAYSGAAPTPEGWALYRVTTNQAAQVSALVGTNAFPEVPDYPPQPAWPPAPTATNSPTSSETISATSWRVQRFGATVRWTFDYQ